MESERGDGGRAPGVAASGGPTSEPRGAPRSRLITVGCFTAVLGTVSGGMVAVLVSLLVAYVTKATACPGIPTCNWYLYWAVGAVVGGISLPWLAVRALRRPRRDASP